mmetsp:Transcript_25998/g.66914  ORF Transcript_25998/g.66914 Transcript_25998/m.66914 type:complete len:223 (+) Transcript_25998:267-935(+)
MSMVLPTALPVPRTTLAMIASTLAMESRTESAAPMFPVGLPLKTPTSMVLSTMLLSPSITLLTMPEMVVCTLFRIARFPADRATKLFTMLPLPRMSVTTMPVTLATHSCLRSGDMSQSLPRAMSTTLLTELSSPLTIEAMMVDTLALKSTMSALLAAARVASDFTMLRSPSSWVTMMLSYTPFMSVMVALLPMAIWIRDSTELVSPTMSLAITAVRLAAMSS